MIQRHRSCLLPASNRTTPFFFEKQCTFSLDASHVRTGEHFQHEHRMALVTFAVPSILSGMNAVFTHPRLKFRSRLGFHNALFTIATGMPTGNVAPEILLVDGKDRAV